MKPRKSNFLAAIEAKRDAAKTPETVPTSAPAPEPDPAAEFRDPTVKAEALADELAESRRELDAERERRRAAENRAARAEADRVEAGSRTALSALIRKRRRPSWS